MAFIRPSGCIRLIEHDFYVMTLDRRVRLRLLLSFLLIIYVLSYSLFDKDTNILPFFYFGFFFVTPLIDHSFYLQRVRKRISVLLGSGYSIPEIILSKTVLIFLAGFFSGAFFVLCAIFLNNKGLLNAVIAMDYLPLMVFISLYNFWIIFISGMIQIRYEIIFPVRLFNITAFLLFVNYSNLLSRYSLEIKYFTFSFSAVILMILLSFFLAGRINRDRLL